MANTNNNTNHSNGNMWGAIATLGAGLLSAGSGLISGHQNRKAVESTNRTNLQIARDTNQANILQTQYANQGNLAVQNAQNAWNFKQWQLENAYNSPDSQRKRFERAGINPYFAMSNIENGNASSLLSADSAPMQSAQSTTGAPMQAPQYDYQNDIAGGLNAMMSVENLKAQSLQNDFTPTMQKLTAAKMIADTKNLAESTRGRFISNNLLEDSYSDLMQQQHARTIGMQRDNAYKLLMLSNQSVANDIQKFYRDNIQPLECEKIAATIDNLVADTYSRYVAANNSTRLTDAQIWKMKKDVQQRAIELGIMSYNATTQRMVGNSIVELNNTAADKNRQDTWNGRLSFQQRKDFYDRTIDARVNEVVAHSNQIVNGANINGIGGSGLSGPQIRNSLWNLFNGTTNGWLGD